MATATTATSALSMKLIIDRKAQRVIYAEASKEVVDFLFSILALPIATAVRLVGKEAMVGSVGNLYASIDKLDSTYLQTGADKDDFLRPTVLSPAATSSPLPVQLLQNASRGSSGKKRNEKKKKKKNASAAISGETTEGLVQGVVTYLVLDNLTVTPMSTISSITLLNTFAVSDIGDLHEKTVQLGYNEGLAVLKASLESKSVLTDVFIHSNNKKNKQMAPRSGGRASS